MTTAAASTALVTVQPAVTDPGRLALAGFLAGYRGLTREAYALDLRQFTTWCRARPLMLFAVRRAGIESFAKSRETRGRAPATVTRRLCAIAGCCPYAVDEELLEHSPAAHVRRPRLDHQSHVTALDRDEVGALLAAAGPGPLLGHALIFAARADRAAGAAGHWGRHRAAGPGARAPDAGEYPQGRQRGDHLAGAAHRPGDRPGPPANGRTGRCSWPQTGAGRTGTAPGGPSARPPAAPRPPRPSRPARSGMPSTPPRQMPRCRGGTCTRRRRTRTRGPRSGMTGPAAA